MKRVKGVIPTLQVSTGYLTPFRSYKCQVSETIDGRCCLGDTKIDLRDLMVPLMKLPTADVAVGALQSQMMMALVCSSRYPKLKPFADVREEMEAMSFISAGSETEDQVEFLEFIYESMYWLVEKYKDKGLLSDEEYKGFIMVLKRNESWNMDRLREKAS